MKANIVLRNATIRAWAPLVRKRGATRGRRALAMHDVEDTGSFERRVAWLRDRYEILPVDKWLNDDPARPALTITFDDGFSSAHRAAQVLKTYEVPALFFVCSGSIDKEGEEAARFVRDRMRLRRPRSFMTGAQLKELAQDPLFEIGCHTTNHADLGTITDRGRLEAEISQDREALAAVTGGPIRYFSYPFGARSNISQAAIEHMEQEGFEAAFTSIPGSWNGTRERRWMVPRDALELSEPDPIWDAWLKGVYDDIYRIKERLRLARRARYQR